MTRRRLSASLVAGATGLVALLIIFTNHEEESFGGRLLSEWILDLHHSDYRVRLEAQEALRQMDSRSIPALSRALHHRDSVIDRTLRAVGDRFPRTGLSIPPAEVVRQSAASMLADLGSQSSDAIPALIQALDDPEPAVVREVERALRRAGSNQLPQLLDALNHARAGVRAGTIRVLRDVAPKSPAILDRLLNSLNDSSPRVREQAALTLGSFGWNQTAVVSALSDLLRDDSPAVRLAAALALGQLQPAAASAIPALLAALADPVAVVRVQAARSAWLNGESPERVLSVLTAALGVEHARWQAAYTLGDLGPDAARAVPALIEMLETEAVPRPLREAPSSAFALGHIGKAAVPALSAALDHPIAHVRTGAAIALGMIGPAAEEAVPALTLRLEDRHEEVRQASALSLGKIEPAAKAVVPVLVTMLDADDPYVKTWAADLLREIDPEAAPHLQPE
jgi:HEAT repeat protein